MNSGMKARAKKGCLAFAAFALATAIWLPRRNHFAELQMVDKVLDARAFKLFGLGKQQLVVLVHSGSRGLGESILRSYVEQHQARGSDAESFAAAAYLQGHDLAVRWAKTNRALIARRFVEALGAEAECLWDGPPTHSVASSLSALTSN